MGADRLSYYEILGVKHDATEDEVKASYREMAKSLHPDKNKFGAQLMKQINEAYATLSDPAMRREYDRTVHEQNGQSDSVSPPTKKRRRDASPERKRIQPFLCIICDEIANKDFWETSCCARLCCESCLGIGVAGKTRTVCPNVSCQYPIRLSCAIPPVGWVKSSKFIQKQIDYVAPAHLCGRNILPEDLDAHNLVCPKLNTQCFMCSGQGKYMSLLGVEVQCRSCDGRKFLSGVDWTKCYKCDGRGSYDTKMGATVACDACHVKGALKGHWTKCFRCNGVSAYDTAVGITVNCTACNAKGALKGLHWQRCFKCKGIGGADCTCRAKGALEGKWTICFKCEGVGWVTTMKGARNNCDACNAKGGLEGFNLRPCHLCKGCGCKHCSWKGSEKCKCAPSCNGHSLGTTT